MIGPLAFKCPACFAAGLLTSIDLADGGAIIVTFRTGPGGTTEHFTSTCPHCGTVLDLVALGVLDGSGTRTGGSTCS